MSGLQLLGKDSIIDAYNECGYDTFALFQGKNFVTGKGADELALWIDKFSPAGSSATYSLRLYADVEPEEVSAKTEYTAAFGCKLSDPYGGLGVVGGYNAALLKRIEALEKGTKDEDDDDDNDIGKIIMGYLKNPHDLATAVGAFRTLFGMAGGAPPAPQLGAIGAFEPGQEGQLSQDQEQQYKRLAAVLERLQKADPQILPHLEKLADIAEKQPATFKMLLSTLDGL